ncbi:hypothetical protein ACFFRR_003280 [Megaselia abdita]
MILVLVAFSVATVATTFFLWRKRHLIKLGFTMPHKGWIPFVGGVVYIKGMDEIIEVTNKCFEELGDMFFTWIGPVPLILVRDVEVAESVLTSQKCISKAGVLDPLTNLLGEGLLTMRDSLWHTHRKYINPCFSLNMLLGFFDIYNKTANELSDSMESHVGKEASDLRFLFARSMMNTATETTMGKTLEAGSKLDLLPQYQVCMRALMTQMVRPWYQIGFLFKFHDLYKPLKTAKLIIKNTINSLIEENINENDNNNGPDPEEKPIFIKQAIKLAKANKFTLDDVDIESNTIVVGAFETTATAIYNALFCLAEHTECQDKLYEEIMAVMPDDVEVTYEHLKDMPYLSMALNESMRLLPAVMFNPREASGDFHLHDSTYIPKGAQFMISIYHIQRSKKYWGPKADEYDPEQFSAENVAKRSPYAFMPFSKGLRNCIGWRYAQFALKIALVKLIKKYKFTTEHKLKNVVIIPTITMNFKDVPKLKVTLR